MLDEIARFEDELRDVALEIVRAVLQDEAARRASEPEAPRRAARPAPSSRPAPASRPAKPTRTVWTRESVIEELATWLLGGTAVEAAFINRHGKPGLVAGAKRIFGRFDAALNAANLHLAQQYPDGIPTPKHVAAAGGGI